MGKENSVMFMTTNIYFLEECDFLYISSYLHLNKVTYICHYPLIFSLLVKILIQTRLLCFAWLSVMITYCWSAPTLLVLSLYCPAVNLPNETWLNIPFYDMSIVSSFLFFKIWLLHFELGVFKTPGIERWHIWVAWLTRLDFLFN